MAYKLKVIKSKSFTNDGIEHTHYVCAYKGRVFGVNSMKFEGNEDMLKVDGKVLTINGDIEVLKETTHDALANTSTTYLAIVPKLGLELADI